MAVFEKKICKTYSELVEYLEEKGFQYDGPGQGGRYTLRWKKALSSTCCWVFNPSDEAVNFIGSNGKMAFPPEDGLRLANFKYPTGEGSYCGVIFMPLADDGVALYMSPVPKTISINELDFCCKPKYATEDDGQGDYVYTPYPAETLQNGLVLCTAPESGDNKWRFSWRYKDSREQKWVIDDSESSITWGKEIPYKRLIPSDLCVTLTKTLLNKGIWSDYIYTQVLGTSYPCNTIFKVGGQKFMTFTDNPPITTEEYDSTKTYSVGDLCSHSNNIYRCFTAVTVPEAFDSNKWAQEPSDMGYRCPAFRLPPESSSINPSSSTSEYSSTTTYKVGDFCIYGNTLYRCTTAVTVPEPFDDHKWTVTTVSAEIARL